MNRVRSLILISAMLFFCMGTIDSMQVQESKLQISSNKTNELELTDTRPDSKVRIVFLDNKKNGALVIDAKWNNSPLRTLFDTGCTSCSAFIWNRAVAERIGVKMNTRDTFRMGGTYRVLSGMIDSLEFGKFMIKNIPVFVSIEGINNHDPRQVKCDSTLNSMFDVVLGLPIIKRLGTIELDLVNNSMSFPQTSGSIGSNSGNMQIINKKLYLDMKVEGINFRAFFDTGNGNGIEINTDFYAKNKSRIALQKMIQDSSAMGGCASVNLRIRELFPCETLNTEINGIKTVFRNKCKTSKNKKDDFNSDKEAEGIFGNYIFHYWKKAVLDFQTMNFSITQ